MVVSGERTTYYVTLRCSTNDTHPKIHKYITDLFINDPGDGQKHASVGA